MVKQIAIAFVMLLLSLVPVHADSVTLRYASWNPNDYDNDKPILEAFEARHPGVTVELVHFPEGVAYWPYMREQAMRGDLPDLFMMSSGYVRSWGQTDWLFDINQITDDISETDFYSHPLKMGVVNDRRVAFPRFWVTTIMFYNQTMFDETGIESPNPDWTWEDFKTAARALTRDLDGDGSPDQWGFATTGADTHLEPWVFRNGGRFLNEEMTEYQINQEAIAALKFLYDLVSEGIAPRPADMSRDDQRQAFEEGRLAMWVDGSWNISRFDQSTPATMKWDIAQVPFGPDSNVTTERAHAWGDHLSISANTDYPELAWELARMLSYEGRSAEDFLLGRVPAHRDIALSRAWYDMHAVPPNRGLLLEIGEQPTHDAFSRNWSQWRGFSLDHSQGLEKEINEAFNGGLPLQAVLESVHLHANQILNQDVRN